MRKLLFLAMMLCSFIAVSAANYTVNDPNFSNTIGKTFTRYYYRTAGSSDVLRYSVTFKVTKASTTGNLGTLEITSVVRDGNEKLGNETWQMYYHLTNSNGSLIGDYMVNSIGASALSSQTTLTGLTLDYEDKAIWELNLGQGAFYVCSGLTSIKQKSNSVAAHDARFGDIGYMAFTSCTALNMDTLSFSGTAGSNAFTSTKIKCLRMTSSNAGMQTNTLTGMSSLSRLEVYTTNMASDIVSIASDVPNLKTIKVLGGTKNFSKGTSPFYIIRNQITTVVMAGSIPDYTFYGCSNLKYLQSNGDLCKNSNNPKIGSYAFGDCTSLTLAAIGGIVDQRAFDGCTALKTIYWRGGDPWNGGSSAGKMTQSPLYAMRNTITKVNFDADFGVSTVPDYICYGLTNLKEVWINYYPKDGKIGYGAFEGCTALTIVNFSDDQGEPAPSSYRYQIGDRAFYGCTALNDIIEFPDGVESIGKYAFYNTTALKECPVNQYNAYLKTIGEGAFQRSAITMLVIPSSVTSLGGKLAGGTGSNLQAIYYLPSTLTRKMAGGSFANLFIETSNGSKDQSDKNKVTAAYLNSSLTEIPDSLFYAYRGLAMVKGIKADGSNTQKFTALKKIGNYAFYYGRGLTNIQSVEPLYNDKLEEIGNSAFEQSDINYSLYLCTNLKRIGDRAFCNTMMTQFNMGNTTTDYTKNELPNLTTIGKEAFLDNKNMTTIVLPQNLSSIGQDAFAKKSSYAQNGDPISTVVYAIKNYPYNNPLGNAIDMSKVDRVLIAENVTKIPASAFKGAAIKGVTIPAYVTRIDSAAFANCASLDTVVIKGNTTSQETNSNFLSVATAPFSRSALRKVIFDDNVSTVGRCLLANTPKLQTIQFGKNMKTIGQYAISNTGLTEITLNNISTIESYAFADNSKLKELTISGTAPSSVSSLAFNNTKLTTIWTTCTNHSSVVGNSTWTSLCNNIKQKDNAYTKPNIWEWAMSGATINVLHDLDCEGKYTVQVVPKDGWYFIKWTDGNTDNPRTFDMEALGNDWFGFAYLDNESLYTIDENGFKVTQLPYNNLGEIKVYDRDMRMENNRGKYRPGQTYVFVPQPADEFSWYQFSEWSYDESFTGVTREPWDDMETGEHFDEALTVRFETMPGEPIEIIDEWGNPTWEPGPDVAQYPNEIYAQYVPRELPIELRVCSNGGGTFTFEGSAVVGQEITLTAVPQENYELDHWGDDKSATSLQYKVKITPEMLYKETFMPGEEGTTVYNSSTKELEPYDPNSIYYAEVCVWFKLKAGATFTITAEAKDPATGEVTGGGTYTNGSTATLTAIPAEGYEFSRWTDNDKSNPRIVTVSHNATYTAVFVEVSQSGSAAYVCDFTKMATKHQQYADIWVYDEMWNVFGAANNNGAWAYAKFGGKDTNLAKANPVYVVNNKAFDKEISDVKVHFNAGSFSKEGMGMNEWGVKVYSDLDCTNLLYTVKGGDFGNEESTVTISAKVGEPWAAGYAIQVYWDLQNTTTSNGIVLVQKIEYIAGSAHENNETYYTIVAESSNPAEGSVVGSGVFEEGEIIVLTAVPAEGYVFTQWSDGNTDNPREIVASEDLNLTAEFKLSDGLFNPEGDATSVRKVMIDGQLYIIRGEKMYNVLGGEVK